MSACQQFELYEAERRVSDKGRRFSTREEVQEFLDELRTQPWWAGRFPFVRFIEIGPLRPVGDSVGTWDRGEAAGYIEMAPNHLDELTILHEISHCCAEANHGSHSHDPYFARIYLELVYRVMGLDHWLDLRKQFIVGGIVFDERMWR